MVVDFPFIFCRVVRDPVYQLSLIETCIERAMQLGHGLSLLHGTLCSLPLGGRDELRGSLSKSQALLTPLLLLQEQLRPNLPDASKAKLLSQNVYYLKGKIDSIVQEKKCLSGIQLARKTEWKLSIYLHQVVRLTLTLWSTDAKSDGSLQGQLLPHSLSFSHKASRVQYFFTTN